MSGDKLRTENFNMSNRILRKKKSMLEKNMEDLSITNVMMDDVGEMGILGLVFRRFFGHVIKHKT
jgi:hypothetical protein